MKKLHDLEHGSARPLIVIQIRAKLPHLQGVIQKVGQFYLGLSYEEAAQMSIRDAARASGTSEAAISRFVKEMGVDSFKVFRESFLKTSSKE